MSEVLACRICLNTDVKLYDMFQYDLVKPYEVLTGFQVLLSDGYPHQACSFCAQSLLKCISFKHKCHISQQLLDYGRERSLIDQDFIKNINREENKLTTPYCCKKNFIISIDENSTIKTEVITDDETNTTSLPIPIDDDLKSVIKIEEHNPEENNLSSDEEPLAKKYKKRKRKKTVTNKKIKANKSVAINIKTEKRNLKDKTLIEEPKYDSENDVDKDISESEERQDSIVKDNEVEIVFLSLEQQIEEIKARKNSANYINSMFKCELCYKGFISEATWKNHMVRHDPCSGPHECAVCRSRWARARGLREHRARAHLRRYICRKCGHVAQNHQKAKEHSKWHDGFMYICNICGASFSKSTSHLSHLRVQHPSGIPCEYCGECFIGQAGLNLHKKRAHRNVEGTTSLLHQCKTCKVPFRTAEALAAHRSASSNKHCDAHLKWCIFCGRGFDTDELFAQHLRKEYQKKKLTECKVCGSVFSSARSCSAHQARAHGGPAPRPPRPGSRPAVCEICGAQYRSKTHLIVHQRSHSGETPYHCDQCPKKFTSLQRLQIHKRTHTGERPYKCSRCPKAFIQKAALNRHDRVHSGARPYPCAHCGKAFSQSNSMKLHARTVHLKLPAPYKHSRKKAE